MRRAVGLLLLAVFASTGSGWLAHQHRMEHVARAAAVSRDIAIVPLDADGHDENNCTVCSTLQMPMRVSGCVPLLICLGLIAAFLTQLRPVLYSQCTSAWTDSRGPPVV